MPTFATLICTYCSDKFKRELKTANQGLKKGIRPYCTPLCVKMHRENSQTLACAECGLQIRRTASQIRRSLAAKESSGSFFCGRSCSSKFRNRKRSGENHPNYKGGAYQDNKMDQCTDCGESRSYLLIVHHMDGNRSNKNKDNHETVCCNCHQKRHLRWDGDHWIPDFKTLTPRGNLSQI